jgi:hypothetical protein
VLRTALFVAILCLTPPAPAVAHDPGLSTLSIRIRPDSVEALLEVSRADLAGIPLDAGVLRVEVDGRLARPIASERAEPRATHEALRLHFERPEGSRLVVTSELLARLPFGHRQYLRVEGGSEALDRILSAAAPRFETALTASRASDSASFRGFFVLGLEHIALGADHLLFLLALLVACPGLGSMLRIVTSFTLAHSLTLVAATLGWIAVPAAVVEPIIAASIVVVAALNLLTASRIRERVALCFGFGLVHGLGFAGALADLGVGSAGAALAVPLLAFNLGVEAGQLAIAAAALPLFAGLRRSPDLAAATVPACSALVGALGLGWLIQRIGGL